MRVDWCVSSWFRIKNTHLSCLNTHSLTRPLNRGLADVVLLVSFLYASVQTLAPCTAHSSLQKRKRSQGTIGFLL